MKTLKIYLVAVMLVSAFVVSANPTGKLANVEEAQQELYKDFKRNLTKWNAMNAMCNESSSAVFIVRGYVDETNNFNITQIIGNDDGLKMKVLTTSEEHPVEASSILKGSEVSFRLKFVKN